MKKTLRFSFIASLLMLIGVVAANATTYTYDLSDITKNFKDAALTENVVSGENLSAFYSADGKMFTSSNSTNTYFTVYASGTYLMLKSTVSLTLPTFTGEKITKLSLTNSSGCSTTTKVAVVSGEEEVCPAVTFGNVSTTYDYVIPAASQNKVLTLKVTNKNCQLVTIAIETEPAGSTTPTINASSTSVDFGGSIAGSPVEKTVTVEGQNLTGNITATITGTGASAFTCTPATLSKDGGSLTVAYKNEAAGEYAATLTLTSGTATCSVELSAKTLGISHAGTKEDPFTVADVIAINNTLGTSSKYWVKGVIVKGVAQAVSATYPLGIQEDGLTDNNIVLSADGSAVIENLPIQLPSGTVRNTLGTKTNPGNVGKEVLVYGSLEQYCSRPGVKSVTDFVLDTTGIDTITANSSFDVNAPVYNAAGQQTSKNAKGILIQNGKKFIKK